MKTKTPRLDTLETFPWPEIARNIRDNLEDLPVGVSEAVDRHFQELVDGEDLAPQGNNQKES